MANAAPFDWSSVTWSTADDNPATGTRLQSTEIGPNTYWRVTVPDSATGGDTLLMDREPHKSNAVAAYDWHISAADRAERVAQLRAQVTAGWTVDITDHDYIGDSRDGVLVEEVNADGSLTLRSKKGWASQGRGFSSMRLTWDGETDADGTTLHLWTIPTGITSRSTPGVPRRVKSFRFHPPTAY